MRVAGTRTMPSARAWSPARAGGGLPGPGARTGEPGGSGSRSPGPAWPAPEPPARSQAREPGQGRGSGRPLPGAGGPERCPRVLQPRWGSWPRPASSPCRPPSSWGGSSTSSTRTPRRISAVTWPASASHSAASSCAGPLPTPSASTSCKPQVRASRGPAVGHRAHTATLGPLLPAPRPCGQAPGARCRPTGGLGSNSLPQLPLHTAGVSVGTEPGCLGTLEPGLQSAAGPLSLCGRAGLPSVPTHPCRRSWLPAPGTWQGQVVPGW